MLKRLLEQKRNFVSRYKGRSWFWPLVILGVGTLLFLLLVNTKKESKPKPSQEASWPVRTLSIEVGSYHPQVILYGKTESPNNAQLTATIQAFVKKIRVKEGDFVKKNQVLVELDPEDAELVLLQRQASVADLEAKIASEKLTFLADQKSLEHERKLVALQKKAFEREQLLQKRKLNAQAQLDQAEINLASQQQTLINRELNLNNHSNRLSQLEAQLKNAKALRSQAELDMRRAQIKAPFEGWVTKIPVSLGERLQPGEAVVHLFDVEQYEIRAQIPFKYLESIKACFSNGKQSCGEEADLKASTMLDGKPYTLKLATLSGEIQDNKGGVEGLFYFDTIPPLLPIGQTLTLVLNLPKQNTLIEIPTQALYGNKRVYILKQERMEPVTVKVIGERVDGQSSNSRILVQSEQLKSGQALIVTQLPNAIKGLKVKVVQ